MSVIDRPDVDFDAIEHAYQMDGEDVLGASTVAKVGSVDDAWGNASAWGFRLGNEGALELAGEVGGLSFAEMSPAWVRQALKDRRMTPWDKRDEASERGSWVHDVLEELGQDGAVPDLRVFAEQHGEEAAGHARSVLAWFLHFRPQFVALEVQVASREHRFAGRYDVRCKIEARRLLPCIAPERTDPAAARIRELAERGELALGLVDLKTSKGVYPTTHFPQLEGYEGAGVEMGFPPTDFRAVLNTWPTGEHDPARDFAVSWATYDDFLAYLQALRAIRRIKDADPAAIRKKARERTLLEALPARSRDLVGLPGLEGMTSRDIGRELGQLRKRGKVRQVAGGVWEVAE